MNIDRRTFLVTLSAAAAGSSMGIRAQGSRLETLTQWMNAPLPVRKQALQASLDYIRVTDPSIQAWVQVLPQLPTMEGPLSGIPFGAKDIMETKGLSTEYGSPIYSGRLGTADATIVRQLRQRGAVLLGKTHTTAFAYRTPAPTRNPRNLKHTPGGSSSGSAAAVAAGMVPVALGTQTGGSVLRPASYCGITGFKASYGLFPMGGVLPFAKTLDTLGFFTHSPDDILALWEAMGLSSGESEDFVLGVPDPMPAVEPAMERAFQATLDSLRRAGVSIRAVDTGEMLTGLVAAQRTVMFHEGARFHEERFNEYGSQLAELADLVREGLTIPVEQYDKARWYIAECKTKMAEIYKTTPVILVPAAPGPAPLGLALTGSSRMNSPWTALGTPAISVPMPVADALPLGLQLTAEHGQDARVIRTAIRLHRILASSSG